MAASLRGCCTDSAENDDPEAVRKIYLSLTFLFGAAYFIAAALNVILH